MLRLRGGPRLTGDDRTLLDRLVELDRSRSARVRESAEKWRNGLAGFTGLITGILLWKGPDPVDGGASWVPVATYVLLMAAITSGLVGTLLALLAAAGTFRAEQAPSTLAELYVMEDAVRRRISQRLAWAVGLSLLMTVLICASVGVAWLGPAADGASGTVTVDLTSGSRLCGVLSRVDAGGIEIKLAKRVSAFRWDAVRGVDPVDAC